MLRAVEKEFKFCCAHRLYHLPEDHQCSNVHGHNYRLLIKLIQDEDSYDFVKDSMVIDFGILKEFQNHLNLNFDHRLVLSEEDPKLNDFIELTDVTTFHNGPTTCENFCYYFASVVKNFIKSYEIPNIKSIKLTLYESDQNSACLKINI